MNAYRMLVVVGIVLIQVSGANAQLNSLDSQTGQNTNASPQVVKAFKTLNFGDDTQTVKDKLGAILGNDPLDQSFYRQNDDEVFWKALFNSDAEYEPYKYDGDVTSDQSDKFQSLRRYFGLELVSGKNDVIWVRCFQLNGNGRLNDKGEVENKGFGGLAVVQVIYIKSDLDKLVAGFGQNYPNARKENKHYKTELLPSYPGAFLEYDETIYSDTNQDRRAELLFPAGKNTVTYTDKCQLSESDKALLSDKVTNTPPNVPQAIIASKKIIDFHMNNYRQSIEATDQAQKAKAKKEADSSSGF